MSQSEAKTPEVVKVVGIFGSLALEIAEKNGQTAEMKVKEGPEIKESLAEDVTTNSKLGEEVAEMDAEDDEDEEAEAYIKFLFDPEVPEVLNEYVIGEISNFLDFDDLCSLRQVNKLWHAGATPAFVRKSAFILRSGKRNKEELEAFENETKELKGMPALKIQTNFDLFGKEAKLFNDILAHVSPSLKSLQLGAWSNEGIFLPRANIQLPALESLIFDSRYVDKESRARIFQTLYACAPNLIELDVLEPDSAILSPLLTEDGSNCRNWALVPKLKSLRIRDYAPSEELSTLAQFPQTWERLEIMVHIIGTNRNNTLQVLAQLLENNSHSLVSLSLEMNTQKRRWNQNPQTLRFPPIFSKLAKLKLEFWDRGSLINFGGDIVNYRKMFPSLTSLSLVSGDDPELVILAKIWAYFFPPRQVFRGLKTLELNTRGGYAAFLPDSGISEDWAENMFPNARIEIN